MEEIGKAIEEVIASRGNVAPALGGATRMVQVSRRAVVFRPGDVSAG